MNSQAIVDEYLPFLANILTPPRLRHSFGVMQVMGELVEIYALDRTQALQAGLLHDVAKDLSVKQQLALAEEAQIEFRYDCERHPVYLHATVGAYLAGRQCGIKDGIVLTAIAMHSDVNATENIDLTLCQCLQAADLLVPVAEWPGMRKLKDKVYSGRLEEAMLLRCGWLHDYFEVRDMPIHPDFVQKFERLSKQLSVDDSFFDRW